MYHQTSQDMKSLSICSMYKTSYNIISSYQKLFTQITIFLALPYAIFSLISTPLSSLLFPNKDQLNTNPTTLSLFTNIAAFLAYIALTIALSLLYFSSVTYSVACIYTDHTDITFKKTLCAFKKAWKRLVLTILAEWVVIFGYTFLAGLILCSTFFIISLEHYQDAAPLVVIIIMTLLMIGGIIYMSIIWIFSKTVAYLENNIYGFKALSKSKSLITGKVYRIIRVLSPISLCSSLVAWVFLKVVVNGGILGLGFVIRIGFGVVCLMFMVGLSVFGVVVVTLCYLICKEDKGESIVKSDVMEHLEIFVDGLSTHLLREKDEHKNLMA